MLHDHKLDEAFRTINRCRRDFEERGMLARLEELQNRLDITKHNVIGSRQRANGGWLYPPQEEKSASGNH